MHIAILTFDGFNELDSLIALGVLNRIKKPDWRVSLCCPTAEVTSMNGVTVRAQSLLEDARHADAVVVGSGMRTRDVVASPELMGRLALDPARQLIAAQCSGTLPTSGTMTMPTKTVPMPSSSIVGSIAETSTSDITPVTTAVIASVSIEERGPQRPPPSWPATWGCVNE